MNTTEQTSVPQAESFREWCKIEIFGHQEIAGLVTVVNLAGPMYRVDVPDAAGNTLFTKYYSPNSIYSITPVAKQIAIGLAVKMDVRPVTRFELAQLARQEAPQLPMGEGCSNGNPVDDGLDHEDDDDY